VVLDGDELTVVSWGAMLPRCLEAAGRFPGRIHLLDLRTIIPWDRACVLESVRRTGKALIVHEDTLTAGFAGEIIAEINAQAFTHLDAPVLRLATPDIPVPFNLDAMQAVLPSVARIREHMGYLLNY
jgi:2-oxoisovalerate dehydrogenase E1 component